MMKSIFPVRSTATSIRTRLPIQWLRLIPGARSLEARDACIADTYYIRQEHGWCQGCSSQSFRDDQPIIVIVSYFLYRGHFGDHVHTFETVDEPDCCPVAP